MGIAPKEASDRLAVFQGQFDDLWRKYQTYSAGEELFGLTVTDYPSLHKIKKELNMLSKLYCLYNAVSIKNFGSSGIIACECAMINATFPGQYKCGWIL